MCGWCWKFSVLFVLVYSNLEYYYLSKGDLFAFSIFFFILYLVINEWILKDLFPLLKQRNLLNSSDKFSFFNTSKWVLFFVRVYNISWGLNHKLKLLVEMVSWYDIRSLRDERWQIQISSIPHFKVEYFAPGIRKACAASTFLAQKALMWEGMLE